MKKLLGNLLDNGKVVGVVSLTNIVFNGL